MPMIMHDSRQIQTSQLPFLGSRVRGSDPVGKPQSRRAPWRFRHQIHGACGSFGGSLAKGMTKISYSGYRFPPDIIQQAIWLCRRFTLSFRDVEDLLAERGIAAAHKGRTYDCTRPCCTNAHKTLAKGWRPNMTEPSWWPGGRAHPRNACCARSQRPRAYPPMLRHGGRSSGQISTSVRTRSAISISNLATRRGCGPWT